MPRTATAQNGPERWEDIPGYEGFYQVSDHGRVRSLDRCVSMSIRGRIQWRSYRGDIMRLTLITSGYLHVKLCRDGAYTAHRIHQLVCRVFHGPCSISGDGVCVAHNDGNKLNNRASNVRWATLSENQQDRKLHEERIITNNKIDENQAREIKARLARGERQKDVAAIVGTTKGVVPAIALKRSWLHLR